MSGRQAPADLPRELLEEIDIIHALGRLPDQFVDLMGVWPDQNAPLVVLDPLRMIVAASAALVGASSRKRRSRSATRCRISSSDVAEASLPV
jgi:hypothetical protein